MSVSIYEKSNDSLNKIAGRESADYWEGTQAQWDALSASEKAEWTGKYVIITDDEEDETILASVTADGVKTVSEILDELYTAYDGDINNEYLLVVVISGSTMILHETFASSTEVQFALTTFASNKLKTFRMIVRSTGSANDICEIDSSNFIITSQSTDVATAGNIYKLCKLTTLN